MTIEQYQEFLYIVPLKQGLKHYKTFFQRCRRYRFLYIVPLKQGLKLLGKVKDSFYPNMFLYIVPLKQGLKLGIFQITTDG